jgi:hypothetical protein
MYESYHLALHFEHRLSILSSLLHDRELSGQQVIAGLSDLLQIFFVEVRKFFLSED